MADNNQIVEGDILFEDVSSSFSGATVYIRIEDVSIADAASKVVVEKSIHNVACAVGGQCSIPFSIRYSDLDERAMYTLSVHVDVDGSGVITPGDYITMESYPLSSSQAHVKINIKVRQVG